MVVSVTSIGCAVPCVHFKVESDMNEGMDFSVTWMLDVLLFESRSQWMVNM